MGKYQKCYKDDGKFLCSCIFTTFFYFCVHSRVFKEHRNIKEIPDLDLDQYVPSERVLLANIHHLFLTMDESLLLKQPYNSQQPMVTNLCLLE